MACGPGVAEGVDGLRAGADPGQTGVNDLLGERAVLGEEAVAGVNRVRAALRGDRDELVLQEVRVAGSGAAQGVRLVGDLHVEGVAVRLGVDGDRGNAVVLARARDATGNLSTVRNEDFADGHGPEPSGCLVGMPARLPRHRRAGNVEW